MTQQIADEPNFVDNLLISSELHFRIKSNINK